MDISMSLKMNFFCAVLLFFVAHPANSISNFYGRIRQEKLAGDPGEPLYLTPLIKAGKIQQAQNDSLATFSGFKNVKSYSGYLTVNEQYSSNMFFWFFPCATDYPNAPVVLWLQGGPGATSMIGLFTENGPFEVTRKHKLKLRKYSWTQTHSVLYIDNPVGTGYSFTKPGGYSKTETDVGNNLYEALLQFFQLFPELQKNDFYISGESYGGKYVPAVGYTIFKNNMSAKQKINLKGLTIGNGLSDPVHQLCYSDYLYYIGLIDTNTRTQMANLEKQGMQYIQNQKWLDAENIFDIIINGDFSDGKTLFRNATGFVNYFNYLVSNDTSNKMDLMGEYIQRSDIRAAIHVGNSTFHGEDTTVEHNLREDIMQSVAPWVSELLSNYKVLIYNGQLDIIVAYPLTINYLKNLKFSAADEYLTAARHEWYVGSELAGYVKQAGNLTDMLVRNAGHMVPTDQPKWALDMITRFTHNKPFY